MSDFMVVDTDILVDAGRGDEKAIAYLEQLEKDAGLSISVVTQMELIIGCQNKKELRSTERFLKRFEILNLNEQLYPSRS